MNSPFEVDISEPKARHTTNEPGSCPAKILSPYIMRVEVSCEECGGSGFDPGGIDPWGPEPCPVCHGARTQWVTRNYLTEAFQIAANPNSSDKVERPHLVAILQHCREVVSAMIRVPEVADPADSAFDRKRSRAKPRSIARTTRHQRYWEVHTSREKVITNRKGERINATFRTQRTRDRKSATVGG